MGQPPFQYPTPDGYPDDANFWMGTLLWRWKFALSLVSGQITSAKPDLEGLSSALGINKKVGVEELGKLFSHFTGRTPEQNELAPLASFVEARLCEQSNCRSELAGLILCAPAFQRY
jgi:hypothetical protein